MNMKKYLAIDIGASSGRHIVGRIEGGKLITEEAFRFANSAEKKDGHLVWDVAKLYADVVEGIKAAIDAFGEIDSLAIDTWGVDYVLLNEDAEIGPCYAYRDDRTANVVAEVHDKISFERLYSATGIQYQPFNTVYQLYDDLRKGRLQNATDFLMIPEYLVFKLTGSKFKEYTNATTTGLVNCEKRAFDREIIDKLGLPTKLFGQLSRPGQACGRLKKEVAEYVGGAPEVLLCATHDTASAVVAIPDDGEGDRVYLSSGTWSLLGTEQRRAHTDDYSRKVNFSNEGGADGSIRYQKNIMGLWMIQSVKRELGDRYSFARLAEMAAESDCDVEVDCNDEVFLAPESMINAIERAAGRVLAPADLAKCIFDSLASCYGTAISEISNVLGTRFDTLYIIGGGCKNTYLNRKTAEKTGLRVIAGPTEATATGNLLVQLAARGEIKDIREGRALVKRSVPLEIY